MPAVMHACGNACWQGRRRAVTRAGRATQVLVRGRIHTVRGKGKSAFLVLRQSTATVQGVLFVDDSTVSKGMVKYASQIPRESIVDVEGTVAIPQNAVESCSQSEVRTRDFGLKGVLAVGGAPPGFRV